MKALFFSILLLFSITSADKNLLLNSNSRYYIQQNQKTLSDYSEEDKKLQSFRDGQNAGKVMMIMGGLGILGGLLLFITAEEETEVVHYGGGMVIEKHNPQAFTGVIIILSSGAFIGLGWIIKRAFERKEDEFYSRQRSSIDGSLRLSPKKAAFAFNYHFSLLR